MGIRYAAKWLEAKYDKDIPINSHLASETASNRDVKTILDTYRENLNKKLEPRDNTSEDYSELRQLDSLKELREKP